MMKINRKHILALAVLMIMAFAFITLTENSEDSDAYTDVSNGDSLIIGNQYRVSHTSDNTIKSMKLGSCSGATIYTDSSYSTTVSVRDSMDSFSGKVKYVYFIPTSTSVSFSIEYKQTGNIFDDTYTWKSSFTAASYPETFYASVTDLDWIGSHGSVYLSSGSQTSSTTSDYHKVSLTINPGSSITYHATAETGYHFQGWYYDTNRVSSSSSYTITLPSNYDPDNSDIYTDLEAWFYPNQYTLTFNPNGGTVSPTSWTVSYGQPYGGADDPQPFPTPTKSNSSFVGWFTQATGGTEVLYTDTYTRTSDQTIYAHWSSTYYNVTVYKGNYASFRWYSGEDETLYTSSSHTYSVASGVSFDIDWYAKNYESGSGPSYTYVTTYDSCNYMATSMYGGGSNDKVTISGSGSYYPARSMSSTTEYTYSYTITYNANGGSGAPGNTTDTSKSTGSSPISATKSITLSSTTPTWTDHQFLGWSTSSTATTASYSAGQSYTFNYGTTNLYAVWKTTSFTVTLTSNVGGTATFSPPTPYTALVATSGQTVTGTYTHGGAIYFAATPLEGYELDHWTVNGTTTTPPTTLTQSLTVVAFWKQSFTITTGVASIQGCTVSISAPGYTTVSQTYGDGQSTISLTVAKNTQVTVTASQITGYEFRGWHNPSWSDSELWDSDNPISITADENYEIYPEYGKLVTVTFDATTNGGVLSGDSTKQVAEGNLYGTLPTASKSGGYVFTGWFTSATGGTQVTSSTKVTNENDHTLYAQFGTGTYTVTLKSNTGGTATMIPPTPYAQLTATSGQTVSQSYPGASSILFTATPLTNYQLDHWTVNGTTTTPPTTLTENITVIAYWKEVRTVTTGVASIQGCTVSISAPGYTTVSQTYGDGQSTISLTVAKNTQVTVTASEINGYKFRGWHNPSWSDSQLWDSDNPISFRADDNYEIYPEYGKKVTVTFDATTNGGVLSGNATKQVVDGELYGALPTATKTGGYEFSGWFTQASGGTQVTSSTTVTRDVDHTLYAQFVTGTYTVTLKSNVGGTATMIPPTPYAQLTATSGQTVSQSYPGASSITFMATPSTNYELDHWTVNGTTATPPTVLTGNITVVAYWKEIRTITTGVAQIPGCTVTLSATGYATQTATYGDGQSTISLKVAPNTNVKVTASQIENYEFEGWWNPDWSVSELWETDNPLTIRADGNYEVYPEYTKNVEVWWDNGYFNGSVEIAFNFPESSEVIHTMTVPMFSYDGIEKDSDGYDRFSMNGYTLTITSGYGGVIECSVTKPDNTVKTYTPYINGHWEQYVLKIDVQKGLVAFQGIEGDSRYESGFSFIDYKEIFEKTIFDISDNVTNMALREIYHADSGEGVQPRFQVTATTTYLNTYGFVMVDPVLNIYDKFPNYDNLRLNLYSFAYYGDGLTINGHHFDMDGSVISGFWYLPKDTPYYVDGDDRPYYTTENVISSSGVNGAVELKPTLNNVYITWTNIHSEDADERVCYLTFVDTGITVNMGKYDATADTGNMTISFEGVWYFTTALYEPYQGFEKHYTMDWDSPFNMSKEAFILMYIGLSILCFLIFNVIYKPGILDYVIVAGAGLVAYILL